jgi:plastocyanin
MRNRIGMTVAAAVAIAAVIAMAASWRAASGPVTTVTLSMKDYAFNGQNPTLRFAPGERVRFVVSNDEDTRVLHNFRIVGLGVPCGPPLMPGERRVVNVTMPRSPGEFVYTCCTHPGMGGKLVIAER